MIKVILLSKELLAEGFKSEPIMMPEVPLLGDRFSINDFPHEEGTTKLSEYLRSKNFSYVATVTDRVWGKHNGEIVLFLTLGLEEHTTSGEKPDYFFF